MIQTGKNVQIYFNPSENPEGADFGVFYGLVVAVFVVSI